MSCACGGCCCGAACGAVDDVESDTCERQASPLELLADGTDTGAAPVAAPAGAEHLPTRPAEAEVAEASAVEVQMEAEGEAVPPATSESDGGSGSCGCSMPVAPLPPQSRAIMASCARTRSLSIMFSVLSCSTCFVTSSSRARFISRDLHAHAHMNTWSRPATVNCEPYALTAVCTGDGQESYETCEWSGRGRGGGQWTR